VAAGIAVLLAVAASAEARATTATDDTAAGTTAGAPTGTEGLRIGQVIWGADRYQLAHARAVEEYAEELGIEVQTIDGQQDATVQANAIEDLIAADVDGILFQPFDPAGAVAPIRAAQEAGIPLATWAIKPDPAVTTPFLELNEYQTTFDAGVNAVNKVKEIFPGDPIRVVALDIPTVALCSELRIQGFVDGVLSADPDAEIVARPDGEGNRLASTTVMEDQLQRDDDFNIITGCNGEMLFGGLAALEEVGRGEAVDKVPVSEYAFVIADGVTEVEAFLNPSSPIMQVAVLAPRSNGRRFLDMLIKYINGEIPQDHVETTGSLLLPADADCETVNELLVAEYGEGVDC
jgi:ABC-type sugar transport system substrate-binding protein